jgi:hypothetical protein
MLQHKKSASVRGTNLGHKPQGVHDRLVIEFFYTVYSFRQSPTEALVETMWKALQTQLGGIIKTVDSSCIYFKGF